MARKTRMVYFENRYWPMIMLAKHLNLNYQTLNSRINNYEFPPKKIVEKKDLRKKAINQVDPVTGKVIRKWETTKEAAKTLDIHASSISRALRKYRRSLTAGGFMWQYPEE